MESMKAWFADLAADFRLNFIDGAKWKWLVDGLRNTLIITFFALLIGIVLGIVVAAVRSSYDKNREALAMHKGFGYYVFTFFNAICKLYLTVIRGTPVMVQLRTSSRRRRTSPMSSPLMACQSVQVCQRSKVP